MPAPRGFTGNSQTVAEYADLALEKSEGITIKWSSSKIGLEACGVRSRSFQTSFSSLRARARRLKLRHTSGDEGRASALDLETRGPYDRLVCTRAPLPNGAGWYVHLAVGSACMDDVEVIDNATGLLVQDRTPDERKFLRLIMKAQQFPRDLTREEFMWLEGYMPDVFIGPNGERWFTLSPDAAQGAPVGQDALLPTLDNLFEDAVDGEEEAG